MRYPPSRRALFYRGLAWAGATWAIDGNGRAYNTPLLNSELLINGDMETWSSPTDLATWTESISGSSTVNREATIVDAGTYAARIDIDGSGSLGSAFQAIVALLGNWVLIDWKGRASTSNKQLRVAFAGSTAGIARNPGATWARYRDCIRALAANPSVQFLRVAGQSASSSLYFDSMSARVIVLPTAFRTIKAIAVNRIATKLYAVEAGTQAGITMLLDPPSGPRNFLIGYHDGENIRLEKCVNGVYTTIVNNTSTFVSGAELEIRRSGTTFQLWYNGAQVGSDQTVSDVSLIVNSRHGLFSTYSGNLFTEFSIDGSRVPLVLSGA